MEIPPPPKKKKKNVITLSYIIYFIKFEGRSNILRGKRKYKNVQVGNDHEKAQSERNSHSKNRDGKNQTDNKVLIFRKDIVSRESSYFQKGSHSKPYFFRTLFETEDNYMYNVSRHLDSINSNLHTDVGWNLCDALFI